MGRHGTRERSGARSHTLGLDAEAAACAALERDGWTVLARRVRTPSGEVDAVAERDGLLAIVEVKARPTLTDAAWALTPRQQRRLLAAGEATGAAQACASTCCSSMRQARCAASRMLFARASA
jgi:putative endonuclease